MVVGSPVRRATECYTRWWYNGRSRGFLQYRWKWPRDKFLQLLSNRRANRPREYCESSVCTRSCGRLASPQPVLLLRTKNPPPSPRVHLVPRSLSFRPLLSADWLSFQKHRTLTLILVGIVHRTDQKIVCRCRKSQPARIYSPVAGLLVLFCILIIARYARVWRRFKNFPLLSTFGSPAFRRLAQPNRIPSHSAHFSFVSSGRLLYILPFRQITSTTLCGFDRASFRNCASRQCTCTVLLTS